MDFRNPRLKLIGILILAASLRFFDLADNPPGLFRDEADKGYSTLSLLQTGRDLAGRPWPLQIKSFGAYTTPLYHWHSLPAIQAMGLTIFSTRFAAAFSGTVACLGIYLLGRAWASEKLGLMGALFLSISPWHLLFCRWANQGILMTLYIPLALWATWRLLLSTSEDRSKLLGWVMVSGLFWALAANTYEPARLFVPLFMIAILLIQVVFSPNRRSDAARLLMAGMISLALASPFVVDILMKWEATQTRLHFLTGEEPLTVFGFLQNYALHWDPRYLFLQGDQNLRHHIPGQGQLAVLESFSSLLGLFALTRTRGTWRGWLLAWILLAPIPAAITQEGLPHALRTLMGVPGYALLSAVGFAWLVHILDARFRKGAVTTASILILLQALLTAFLFFEKYPKDERVGLAWETGFVEAIRWIEETRQTDEICTITGFVEFPEAHLQFVLEPDPEWVQNRGDFPGYHLLPTGATLDPRIHRQAGLYLERAWLAGKPSNWVKVPPSEAFEKMDLYWRLYRVSARKD